jgi:RNA recognition motif-containing protein
MKNIFVGNLDFGATDSSIRSLFEPYGAVERVNVVTDRDTGRSRGFAFVEMSDSAQADQAIAALNGATLEGRTLNVNEARPKPQGGGGYAGGNSRGGNSRGGGGGYSRGGGQSRSRW